MKNTPAPVIVALVGLPFVGKTTLGQRLAEHTGFSYLGVDAARKEVERDTFDPSRRQREVWERDIMLKAYHHNHTLARHHLLAGTSVILDATYSRPAYHTLLIELARALDARLVIFHVIADPLAVWSRVKTRPAEMLSNIRTMSDYTSVAKRYVLIDYPHTTTVDTTSLPIESAVTQMLDAIYSSNEKE